MAWGANKQRPEGAAPNRDTIENVLGRSCLIRGDLAAEGAFRIDGTIEGSVESRGAVIVGETGVVRGSVRGSDVVIAGTVEGNVACPGHLEILAKGKVEGDIDARSVRIETGGVFCGTSRMGDQASTAHSDGTPGAIPASARGELSSAA